ncbi:ester cyclase [Alcaligenaceae bacterium]|nr:ester cyclase [Alcaligenaceae bacterium]
MKSEEMKRAIRECMLNGFSTGNIDHLDQFFHTDYKRTSTVGHPSVNNLAEHKADLISRRDVFTDAKFEIVEMIAENDTVAVRYVTTGTHKKEYLGVSGTDRQIRRESCAFFQFTDGKIASSFVLTDVYGTLEQLKRNRN